MNYFLNFHAGRTYPDCMAGTPYVRRAYVECSPDLSSQTHQVTERDYSKSQSTAVAAIIQKLFIAIDTNRLDDEKNKRSCDEQSAGETEANISNQRLSHVRLRIARDLLSVLTGFTARSS